MKKKCYANLSPKQERRYTRKMAILKNKMLNQQAVYEANYLIPAKQTEDAMLYMGKAILNAANQIGNGKSLGKNMLRMMIGTMVAVNSIPVDHRTALEP